jgi:hypothetical protein
MVAGDPDSSHIIASRYFGLKMGVSLILVLPQAAAFFTSNETGLSWPAPIRAGSVLPLGE